MAQTLSENSTFTSFPSAAESAPQAGSDTLGSRKSLGIGKQRGSMARRRFQTGSVYKQGKVWKARWREDMIQNDGEVHRVNCNRVVGTLREIPTKPLAMRKLQEMISHVNATDYRAVRVATLAEFVERYRTEVLAQAKPATIDTANSHLRYHILPALGSFRLDEISTETHQRFISRVSKKLSRKTVKNILGTLSKIVATAKAWGYGVEPVCYEALVLPPIRERRPARFFSLDETRKIIEAAPEPYATAFAVAALTAVRPGELFGLKSEDLDFEQRRIFIRRAARYSKLQTTKTAGSVRTVPMPEQLARRLEDYLLTWRPNPAGILFATKKGTPLSANGVVQRRLWPILDKLEIPRCGLKAFRHTHSSLLVDQKASPSVAQAQLGHTDARTTLGIYSHVVGDSQRIAVSKLADSLFPNVP